MTTPLHRRRRVNEEEEPKKNTTTTTTSTTRMALIDHFQNDDGHESHSRKRRTRSLFQRKLKRVGLMMISSVFGQKKSGSFAEGENGEVPCMESEQCTSGRESQQPGLALKILPAKVQLSFNSLFNRTKKGASENELGNGKAGVVTGRREESLGKLQRVSSRTAIQTLKMKGSMRGKSSFKKNSGEQELCKKRILMGGRCRPLNNTGSLHYDADGFLLPDLPP